MHGEGCPFQAAIDVLSKRHALTIVWLLQKESPRRFNAIKRALAVNPVTLAQRLEELQGAGIVARREYHEVPPRVEYLLTAKGLDLLPLMQQLDQWARRHPADVLDAGHATPVAAP